MKAKVDLPTFLNFSALSQCTIRRIFKERKRTSENTERRMSDRHFCSSDVL